MHAAVRALGEKLRQQRERLGLSLEEVEQQTKIRKHYLRAIENGEWDFLPGDVYARGFVRTYAELLQMDGMALLAELDAVHREQSIKEKTNLQSTEEPSESRTFSEQTVLSRTGDASESSSQKNDRSKMNRTRPSLPGGALLQAGVVGVVLAAIVVGIVVLHNDQANRSPMNHTTADSALSTSLSNHSNQSSTSHPSSSTSQATYGHTTNLPKQPTVSILSSPVQNGAMTYTVSGPKPTQVTITATAANGCWLQATVNGAMVNSSLLLSQGASHSWTGSNILLRVGNVPGASLKIDGQSVALPSVQQPLNIDIVQKS